TAPERTRRPLRPRPGSGTERRTAPEETPSGPERPTAPETAQHPGTEPHTPPEPVKISEPEHPGASVAARRPAPSALPGARPAGQRRTPARRRPVRATGRRPPRGPATAGHRTGRPTATDAPGWPPEPGGRAPTGATARGHAVPRRG